MDTDQQHGRKAEFRKLVEEQEKSGLTQKEFCSQKNLVLSQFVYYRCLLKKEAGAVSEPKAAFKPVRIPRDEKNTSGEIRIFLPNGFSCQFPQDIEPAKARQLVQALLLC